MGRLAKQDQRRSTAIALVIVLLVAAVGCVAVFLRITTKPVDPSVVTLEGLTVKLPIECNPAAPVVTIGADRTWIYANAKDSILTSMPMVIVSCFDMTVGAASPADAMGDAVDAWTHDVVNTSMRRVRAPDKPARIALPCGNALRTERYEPDDRGNPRYEISYLVDRGGRRWTIGYWGPDLDTSGTCRFGD